MADYTCGGCGGFNYGTIAGLRLHQSMNGCLGTVWAGERQCSRCPYIADNRDQARLHASTCTGNIIVRNTTANGCIKLSRKLTRRLGQETYVREKIIEKTIIAGYYRECTCGESFRSLGAYNNHKWAVHYNHACDCGKKFILARNMLEHIKICKYIPELEDQIIILGAELAGIDDVIYISSDESSDDSSDDDIHPLQRDLRRNPVRSRG